MAELNAMAVKRLGALAKEIGERHDQFCAALRTSAEQGARIGDLLKEAKALVGHGGFTEWIAANCEFTPRMGRNYMRLADKSDEGDSLVGPIKDLLVESEKSQESKRKFVSVLNDENQPDEPETQKTACQNGQAPVSKNRQNESENEPQNEPDKVVETDPFGNVLGGTVLEAFGMASEFTAIVWDIQRIRQRVKELKDSPAGRHLNAQEIESELKLVGGYIKDAKPYCVTPPGVNDKQMQDVGYLTKSQYGRLPSEFKYEAVA